MLAGSSQISLLSATCGNIQALKSNQILSNLIWLLSQPIRSLNPLWHLKSQSRPVTTACKLGETSKFFSCMFWQSFCNRSLAWPVALEPFLIHPCVVSRSKMVQMDCSTKARSDDWWAAQRSLIRTASLRWTNQHYTSNRNSHTELFSIRGHRGIFTEDPHGKDILRAHDEKGLKRNVKGMQNRIENQYKPRESKKNGKMGENEFVHIVRFKTVWLLLCFFQTNRSLSKLLF